MKKFGRYYKAVDFLEGLSNLPLHGDYFIDTGHPEIYIERMRYFLSLIGNPDRGLHYIHIAGTSGKGTVTTMLHEIISASGKRVGSFTSPSVITSIEKIRVGDKYISPDEFADIVECLKPFIDQSYLEGPYGRPSYFEIVFAIAVVYFKKKKCDWVVLEAGLGGRYDATNVIERPLATVITNIDFDHTEILGKTLQKIAFDKAGIVKKGSAFFTTEQRPSLLKIFTDISIGKHVSMHKLPRQDSYQKYNEALSASIAQHMGLNNAVIARGIQNTRLPCRFETISMHPTVVLDGAHNRSKIKSTVDNLKKITFRKLYLLISIADNKNHASILQQIIPLADHVFFTRFQNVERKCAHPKELLKKSRNFLKRGVRPKIFLDPEQALSEAIRFARADDLILVTGSFFLAGELREQWYPEEWILEHRKSLS